MDIISAIIILKIILAVVIAGGLVFLGLAGFSVYTNLTTGVPWAKISEANIKKIFGEINLAKKSLIYDLGCGDARVLFMAERLGLSAVGYELSFYPYIKSRLKKFISGSAVILKRQNFFKKDLSQADAVFVFLVGKVMARVGHKLGSELKKGSLVVSYCFSIPGWKPEKIILTKPNLTYIYRI